MERRGSGMACPQRAHRRQNGGRTGMATGALVSTELGEDIGARTYRGMEERRSSAALVERRRSCRHAHKVFEKMHTRERRQRGVDELVGALGAL
uniref:Uncharacterized protein n=1 Tax=Oryza rufipogon TaxID=4529 RepID=A0A0E0P5X6_ORYRU